MNKPALLATVLLVMGASLVAPSASAFRCEDPPTLEVAGIYVDIRQAPTTGDPTAVSVRLFAESGAAVGLQRGADQVVFWASGTQDIGRQMGQWDSECESRTNTDLMIL